MSKLIVAKLGVLALLAVLALGITVDAGATVAPEGPEYGRCLKKTPGGSGTGYADKGCTSAVGSGAGYEWVPGIGPKTGFTESAGATTLETHEGRQVSCTGMAAKGAYTGASSLSLTITLTGCQLESAKCQSGASAGEVVSEPLEGLIGNIKAETAPFNGITGLELRASSGETFMAFECGGTNVVVSGGTIHEVRSDKMLKSGLERFKLQPGSHGKGEQTPECFDSRTGNPLISERCAILETSIGGGPPVQSALKLAAQVTNEEKLEVRAGI